MQSRFHSLVIVVAMLCVVSTAFAQDKKKVEAVDPSGTWRWEHVELGTGVTIRDVLRVNLRKDGRVMGTYQGNDKPLEIQEGKMDGDRMSFQFDIDVGQTITVQFDGKIKRDDIKGEIMFETNDSSGSFPWSANRTVEFSDLVGIWHFSIETSGGDTLTPIMTVVKSKQEKKPLKATWQTTTGQAMEVTKLDIKRKNAVFRIVGEFDGAGITVDFKARPFGDKMKGTLKYDIEGIVGEGEFSCTRQQKQKKKD